MTEPSSNDRTAQLRHLMQNAGWSSYRALRQAAGISEKQIRNLRQGKLTTMRLETVMKLSQTLQITVAELVEIFGQEAEGRRQKVGEDGKQQEAGGERKGAEGKGTQEAEGDSDFLRQEYDRLQVKLGQQKQELWQEFQQESLQALESLLLQLPTAMYAAQQNPQAPAIKLLPLLRPIDSLLRQWGIEPIASVGDEIAYDPQQHQLMDGSAVAGDRVRVRYVGYRQGDRLLYRAKVSPTVGSAPNP